MRQADGGGGAVGAVGATPSLADATGLFQGFWMGGFEGADHVNARGDPLDMAASSGHLDRLDEDHRRAAAAGLQCVRESIGWRVCEDADGRIDLSRALRIAHSARRHGLQVLWTVMHYGVPTGVSLRDDRMIGRLARFGAEVARQLAPLHTDRPPVYTPVNEIGFLAWAASQPGHLAPPDGPAPVTPGEERQAADDSRISGYEIKRRLARASLAALKAMRSVDPRCRFLHVEPLVHVEPPRGREDLAAQAELVRSWQWQAWDLIAGRLEPDLGGSPQCLDLLGVNHYHSSQWELHTERRLEWAARDPRRRPMSALLHDAWTRYRRPLIVAETSHVGRGRADWLHEMAGELRRARTHGVAVHGLCIYPLVDRPDWNEPGRWHKSGLWHVDPPTVPGAAPRAAAGTRPLARHGEPDSLAALRDWRRHGCGCTELLLVLSHRPWQGRPGRLRQLMQAFARIRPHWRVVVVDPAPAVAPEGPPPGDSRHPHPHPGTHHDHGLTWVAGGPNLDLLMPRGTQNPAPAIRRWLVAQALQPRAVWVACPSLRPLADALELGPLVYDCATDLSPAAAVPGWAEGGQTLHEQAGHKEAGREQAGRERAEHEKALMGRAARVVFGSAELAARHSDRFRTSALVLPNGVDRRRFKPARALRADWALEEARSLVGPHAGDPRTVTQLGFVGAIDDRLDLTRLAALADARPHWQWHLVGPVQPGLHDRLPRRDNLHWLGDVPAQVVPVLMRGWRVAVWLRQGPRADRGAVPCGVLEALAAGLAVVAPVSASLQRWRAAGVVDAGEVAEVLRACEAAMAESPAHAVLRRRRARRGLRGLHWPELAGRLAEWLAEWVELEGQL